MAEETLVDVAHGAQQQVEPTREQILEAFRRIVSHKDFGATERLRHLLEYLVTEAVEGRAARIKAYSIATEVLGRPSTFDPQKDPIVRIEVARLRRELDHYYLTGGREDALLIDIPKGAYVPHFTVRSVAAEQPETPAASAPAPETEPEPIRAPAPAALPGRVGRITAALLTAAVAVAIIGGSIAWLSSKQNYMREGMASQPRSPGVIVKPLTDLIHDSESALLAQGLTERIIEKISRFKEVSVLATNDERSQIPETEARYEFSGAIRANDGRLMLQARLVDRADGRVIWADSFDAEMNPRQMINVEREIADRIATLISEPAGVVFEAERRLRQETAPENWDAYYCTITAYAYRASFSAAQYTPVRACLERAVADYPDYATAWALLSLAYVDEVRFLYDAPAGNTVPALTRAYEAAKRAVDLDPSNIRSQQALMMALFFRGEHARAIEVGRAALALNSNDTEFKGDFGFRLALTGQWAEGCKLVEEALQSSAGKIAYYRTANSLCHYFSNDLTRAATLIHDADADENPAYHVIAAAIMAEANDMAGAAEHLNWLKKTPPELLARLIADIPKRLIRAEDRARFILSLRKAGFIVEG